MVLMMLYNCILSFSNWSCIFFIFFSSEFIFFFSFVSSLASLKMPPTLAQYHSDTLASVFLTSGRDFLPIINNLYKSRLLSLLFLFSLHHFFFLVQSP